MQYVVIFCPQCKDLITVPLTPGAIIELANTALLKPLEAPSSVDCKRCNIEIELICAYTCANPEIPLIEIKSWSKK